MHPADMAIACCWLFSLVSIRSCSIQREIFKMLDPFFKFILLDPKCCEQYAKLRDYLNTELVQCIDRTADVDVRRLGFHYLTEILSHMQVIK